MNAEPTPLHAFEMGCCSIDHTAGKNPAVFRFRESGTEQWETPKKKEKGSYKVLVCSRKFDIQLYNGSGGANLENCKGEVVQKLLANQNENAWPDDAEPNLVEFANDTDELECYTVVSQGDYCPVIFMVIPKEKQNAPVFMY